MADLNKLNQSLDQMIQLMVSMKESLSEDEKPADVKINTTKGRPQPQIQGQVGDLDSFDKLQEALKSDKWPEAVNPNLICDPTSDSDKVERGRGIIELMIEEDLKDLKILDYGCGEGHCANLATDYKTKISVGYDPKVHETWKDLAKENLILTDDFETVKAQGPYDIIILFDVIDHIQHENPVELLKKVKELLSDEGKIYLRCHPLMSRHATHLYHSLNKAYVHLVFTPEELQQLCPDMSHMEENSGVKYPLKTYHDYITDSGLRSVNRRDITEKVEPFFKIPKIAERIIGNTGFTQFPEFQMGLQFIDFVLRK